MHAPLQLNRSQRRVLELIRRRGPVSRVELAEPTNLTAGAISRHCRELLLTGLIEEQERRFGGRGQPAVPLVISKEGGFSIGISVSFQRVEMVAIDYAGGILAHVVEVLPEEDTQALLAVLETATARLNEALAGISLRIVGVGLAISGAPARDGMRMAKVADFMAWLHMDALKEWVQRIWQVPLLMGNNAKMAALSEYHAADNPDLRYLVGVNIGYGMGCGVVQDGKLFSGVEGRAGAVSALYPKGLPRPTARDLIVTLQSCGRDVSVVEDLEQFRVEDDPVVSAWVERVATQLSPLLSTIWLLLGPEEVVVTGHLPQHIAGALSAQLADGLNNWHTESSLPVPRILPARLGRLSIVVGAAWLPILREGTTGELDEFELS